MASPLGVDRYDPSVAPTSPASPIVLSIVLPAYNEEENIVEAVRRATAVAERLCVDHEIVVVDDGSRDRTAHLVRDLAATDPRIRLVRHARNLGYGEALRTGFRTARLEYVFFTDADNQFDLNELEDFLPWAATVDVVAGYRANRNDPIGRRLNAGAWNRLVRSLFDVPVRDINCAFKLFRRDVFDEIDIESRGAMVNTELMVKLAHAGAEIIEFPVTHYPRTAGVAQGANPRVILRAFWELFRRPQAGEPDTPPMRIPALAGGITSAASSSSVHGSNLIVFPSLSIVGPNSPRVKSRAIVVPLFRMLPSGIADFPAKSLCSLQPGIG